MKKTINLNNFRLKYPQYNHIPDDWFIWFIGFFEGDGCFTIGKKNVEIVITQREDNKHVLDTMLENFKFGTVIVQTRHIVPGKLWTYKYIVRDFAGQNVLLNLFHDNLVIPIRQKKFNQFVLIYNQKLDRAKNNRPHKYKNINPIDSSTILCWPMKIDTWIVGFIDAEGCFYTSIRENKVRMCFDICQKDYRDYSVLPLLEHIQKEIFNAGIISRHTHKSVICLRVTGIRTEIQKVHDIFNITSLKTNKLNNYLRQKEILFRYQQNHHLVEKSLREMIVISNSRF